MFNPTTSRFFPRLTGFFNLKQATVSTSQSEPVQVVTLTVNDSHEESKHEANGYQSFVDVSTVKPAADEPSTPDQKTVATGLEFVATGTTAKSFKVEWAKWSAINISIGDGLFTIFKTYKPEWIEAVGKALGLSLPFVGVAGPIILGLVKTAIIMRCCYKKTEVEITSKLEKMLVNDIEPKLIAQIHDKEFKKWVTLYGINALIEFIPSMILVSNQSSIAQTILETVQLNPAAAVGKTLIGEKLLSKFFGDKAPLEPVVFDLEAQTIQASPALKIQ